jgi:hypothetical protein
MNMNIDRIEFIAWMERILERLDLLKEHIDESKRSRNSIDGEELLDNQDLLQMLKISNRSLQRYRSIGKLQLAENSTTNYRMYTSLSGKVLILPPNK